MFTKFVRRYRHFYFIINSSIVFLNRLYKYQRPLNDTDIAASLQLLIRFEKGEWMIFLTDKNNEILAFEWLETGEYLDEPTMQTYLIKFLNGYNFDAQNVHLVICSEQFHFLPAGFTSLNMEWIMQVSNVYKGSDRLVTEVCNSNTQIELVYPVSESLLRVIDTVATDFDITHQASLFCKEQLINFHQHAVYICLYRKYALIQAKVNDETFFLKRIPWNTQDDLLFEVMSLYKHFSLNPAEVPMYAGGMITPGAPIFHVLQRYIKDVYIIEYSSFLLLSHLPDLHENQLIEKVS